MRISFLCGCLEPHQDGVGDYVRRCAARFEQAGHSVQLIALADPLVGGDLKQSHDWPSGGLLRLSAAAWQRGELDTVVDGIRAFGPDVLSLQMVCYAYAHRGIMAACSGRFARLARLAPHRHLMMHELWLGQARRDGFRPRVVGSLQRHFVLQSMAAWSPQLVSTSNPVYVELLRRRGMTASRLPLPGNIECRHVPAQIARAELLAQLGAEAGQDRTLCLTGVFGSIHPEWEDPETLCRIDASLRRAGRRLALLQIGRPGTAGDAIWRRVAEQLAQRGIVCRALGEMSSERVSAVLSGLDMAIATTPWSLIGKSGTTAALIEHGVPVLVTRDEFRLRSGATPTPQSHPLLARLDEATLEAIARGRFPDKGEAARVPAEDPFRLLLGALETIRDR